MRSKGGDVKEEEERMDKKDIMGSASVLWGCRKQDHRERGDFKVRASKENAQQVSKNKKFPRSVKVLVCPVFQSPVNWKNLYITEFLLIGLNYISWAFYIRLYDDVRSFKLICNLNLSTVNYIPI